MLRRRTPAVVSPNTGQASISNVDHSCYVREQRSPSQQHLDLVIERRASVWLVYGLTIEPQAGDVLVLDGTSRSVLAVVERSAGTGVLWEVIA